MAAIGRRGGLRAGRSASIQNHTETAERQGVNNETSVAKPPVKDYVQPTGDTPPVVLPHWREASLDRATANGGEHDVSQTGESRELPPDETAAPSPLLPEE
jgi:hypothetical protein